MRLENRQYELLWTPFSSLFVREVRRFLKVIFQTIATPLISTTLYLLIFGVSIGQEIRDIQNVSYMAFLIPGLVMMAVLRNAFDNASGSIITAKFCGELESMRMTPLSYRQITWGIGLASLIRGCIVGSLTWLIGAIFLFVMEDSLLLPAHPFLLALFLFLGGFAFACLGIATTMVSRSIEEVSAVNTFLLVPLIYLGGVFFSLQQLHPVWQHLSSANPLLYFVNGVRYGLLGFSDVNIDLALLVCIATASLFYYFCILSLKKGSYKSW